MQFLNAWKRSLKKTCGCLGIETITLSYQDTAGLELSFGLIEGNIFFNGTRLQIKKIMF